jgi:hypothetical protein
MNFENNHNNRNRTVVEQNTVLIEDSLRLLLRIWNYSAANRCRQEDNNDNNNNNDNINSNNNNTHNNENNDRHNVYNDKIKKSKNREVEEENNNLSTGGNFVRDLAFIQTTEIVLSQIGSLEILFVKTENKDKFQFRENNDEKCGGNNGNKENTEMKNNITASLCTVEERVKECSAESSVKNILPSSLFQTQIRIRVLVDRIIQKLLNGMSSNHCKIALLCLNIASKQEILLKYFVTIPVNDDDYDYDYDDDRNRDRNESEQYNNKNDNNYNVDCYDSIEAIHIHKKSPKKDSNKKEIDSITAPSDDLINWKQDKFDRLVEVLRKNRNHWHPNVKALSGELFDTLLNYLE